MATAQGPEQTPVGCTGGEFAFPNPGTKGSVPLPAPSSPCSGLFSISVHSFLTAPGNSSLLQLLQPLLTAWGEISASCSPGAQTVPADMCRGEVRHFPPVQLAWWDSSYF